MRRIDADAPPGSAHQHTLTLPFDLRQKSRLRARLDGGEEVALQLPRGRVLRGGDLLRASDGSVVLVRAAAEDVSTVRRRMRRRSRGRRTTWAIGTCRSRWARGF